MTNTRPLPITFPLHGTRLIEASAGTGKTFTLAALYLRLVLGHGEDNAFSRPLLPPEVLVVTFTEAATEELRERIRDRLADAARIFADANADADDPVLAELLNDYREPEDRARCAQRLDAAASVTACSNNTPSIPEACSAWSCRRTPATNSKWRRGITGAR